MKNLTPEIIEKARDAQNPEELRSLAAAHGWEMTPEEGEAYFARLCPAMGELADEELENISGGGCHGSDGRMITTVLNHCYSKYYTCKLCGEGCDFDTKGDVILKCTIRSALDPGFCQSCKHCTYERGLWICNHPAHRQ